MTASKYPAYMDFVRWELIARTKLFNEIVLKGLAPTLGSQKLIYRRPLKRWTKFTVRLETAGWDDKWVYHIHTFEQNSEVKSIGVTKALIWKKDQPQILLDILKKAGVENIENPPPEWVLDLFNKDHDIITGNLP
jgi:acyl-CoA thioesterase FadM